MERTCDRCGQTYRRPPSLIGHYCSKTCAYAARRKERVGHRRMRRHLDHPLAGKTGLVSEARALLYDSIGPGPHRCHWCGDPVEWTTGKRGNLAGVLVVDHVDCDPLNDSLNNLVASCGPCNGSRSPERRVADDELFIVRSNGTRLRAVERICEKCGDTFLAPHDQVRIGKGRFCSRSCARQQKRS